MDASPLKVNIYNLEDRKNANTVFCIQFQFLLGVNENSVITSLFCRGTMTDKLTVFSFDDMNISEETAF
jgi:hypothetical protein